jgi:hypothetical protein
MSTSRVISLFDARTTAHQPTISVFNPTETDVFGLSWDGSNTLPSLKSSTNSVALQAGGSKLLTANFIGGNTAEAYLGTTGSTTGRVTMTNYGNSNTVSLQSGVTGASYTTNLMTSIGTAGQCLYVASVTGSIQDLGYTSCAGSGSGSGVTTVGIFSAASIVNGASISGTTITFGAADGTNPGMVSTIAQTFAGAKTFTGAMLINTTSATALQVQAAGGNALLTADTSAGQVLFGKASALTGKLVIANSTNANTVTITSGATSASYTITLPTSVGGANQCLMNSATPGVLTWGTCGGGSGSGGTQTITLVPEFVGATFSTSDGSGASSGNNTGYMTSDYAKVTSAEGYKHNYYQWYTDQATAQDYHIITQYQLPSNFTSFAAGSWTAWSYRTSTSGSIGYTIYDAQGNSCSSGTLSFSGSASTWYQSAMNSPSTTAPCSFAANDIITIDFKLIAQSPSTNYTRLGEVRFSYN